ncbi:hypothetical protein V6N13_063564 [Hibiscus sabdariffa]
MHAKQGGGDGFITSKTSSHGCLNYGFGFRTTATVKTNPDGEDSLAPLEFSVVLHSLVVLVAVFSSVFGLFT